MRSKEIIKDKVIEGNLHEFIPIATHYSKNSVITKAGDILQIVKIDGFTGSGNFAPSTGAIRDILRKFIQENISSMDYWVYIHTIRDRKDISSKGGELFGFSKELNDQWIKKNNWDKQLVNGIYVTIVKRFDATNSSVIKNLIDSFLIYPLKDKYFKFFEDGDAKLKALTDKLIESMSEIGAKRLQVTKTSNGYLSEPLSLYYRLIRLEYRETLIPVRDLSRYNANLDIKYDFNHMHISNATGSQYCAIFSLKEYVDVPVVILNKFMQLGVNFTITETLHLANPSPFKESMKEILQMYKIGGSEDLIEVGQDALNADLQYFKHQVTILVNSDLPDFFFSKVEQVSEALSEIGLSFIREDFNMARCFWSQLPGNFQYFIRPNYIASDKVAGFASIHQATIGNYRGSKWGPPISILRTMAGTPYYLNLHDSKGNGNTMLIGPQRSGKTTIMRFLLTRACKVRPRIIYLDIEGGTKKFIDAIGGVYMKLTRTMDSSPIKINPFDLDCFDGSAELMGKWLLDAIAMQLRDHQGYLDFFTNLAQNISKDQSGTRKLEIIKLVIEKTQNSLLQQGFDQFMNSELFTKFFSDHGDQMNIFKAENIISVDFSDFASSPQLLSCFMGLILSKLRMFLDGSPTIIAMNRITNLCDSYYFKSLLPQWIDDINAKNAIAFFSLNDDKIYENEVLKDIVKKFGTQITLSNKYADKRMKKILGLSEKEFNLVKHYDTSRRVFLLKQDGNFLVAPLDLSDLPNALEVLGQ